MRNAFLPMLLVFSMFSGSGCDLAGGSEQAPQYVVEGYLTAGGEWRPVRVSRTTTVQDTFSFSELAVAGADVHVEKLDENGEVVATYPYRDSLPGLYAPDRPEAPVEPLGTYRLRVEVPPAEGGPHTITATTTVPDTFRIARAPADTVTYQGAEQLQLSITQSRYPGRRSKFAFSTRALGNLNRERLTPLLREFLDEEDVSLNDIRQNTSPIVNESNYDVNPDDGTITISVPWIIFAFYGPNRLSARALDDNFYDYLRSFSAQQGSPTLAPGEIPNVIDHVEGGTGLFGSYSRVSHTAVIQRAPSNE